MQYTTHTTAWMQSVIWDFSETILTGFSSTAVVLESDRWYENSNDLSSEVWQWMKK